MPRRSYGERYSDVYPLVQRHIAAFQNEFFKSTERIDAEASKLYTTDPKAAIRLITNFTARSARAHDARARAPQQVRVTAV